MDINLNVYKRKPAKGMIVTDDVTFLPSRHMHLHFKGKDIVNPKGLRELRKPANKPSHSALLRCGRWGRGSGCKVCSGREKGGY